MNTELSVIIVGILLYTFYIYYFTRTTRYLLVPQNC